MGKKQNFRDFYEQVGEKYPEEELVFQTLRGVVRKQFVRRYLKTFRGLLLDLACNKGYYAAEYANGAAVGVDLSFAVLRKAYREPHVRGFIQGDAQDLSFFKPAVFAAVLCSEMLEHVPDPDAVFFECFRVLSPGGVLLLTTPNYSSQKPTWVDVGQMANYGIRGVENGKYFHTAYRPEELRAFAEKVGFQVLEVGTFEKEVKYATRLPVVFYHVIRLLNRTVLKSNRVEAFNREFLDRSSLLFYRMCRKLHIHALLIRLIREGVRSYILVRKPAKI